MPFLAGSCQKASPLVGITGPADNPCSLQACRRARITKPARARSSKTQPRQRQARRARAARRPLRPHHDQLPRPARALSQACRAASTAPTYDRFVFLAGTALPSAGNHTTLNRLRTRGPLVPGAPSGYHRAFSHRRRSSWCRARRRLTWLLTHRLPDGPIDLAGDDTVDEQRGQKVYGKGRHRDPVRSTPTSTALRWGHQWVVRAVLGHFPWARRRWALPVLVALYRPEGVHRPLGRRHKTPPPLRRPLVRVPLRWFPDRHFVGAADGNYATHDWARSAARYRDRLTYLSHFDAKADLYEPAPAVVAGKKPSGRPRQKGAKLPAAAAVAQRARPRQRLNGACYGGGRRDVDVISQTAHWYEAGAGLVAVLWARVHDGTGTHRAASFVTPAVTQSVAWLTATDTGRWDSETTFDELRAYLGPGTTRGRLPTPALRGAPCRFGLDRLTAALYAPRPARQRRRSALTGAGKQDSTCSDALTAVRRWRWVEWVLAIPGQRTALTKLSRPSRQLLRAGLAPAA